VSFYYIPKELSEGFPQVTRGTYFTHQKEERDCDIRCR